MKARVRRAVDGMLLQIEAIMRRTTDGDGSWEAPGDVAQFGDTTGLLGVAEHSVVRPLAETVHRALTELATIRAEVEQYKRDLLGSGYQPPARDHGRSSKDQDLGGER